MSILLDFATGLPTSLTVAVSGLVTATWDGADGKTALGCLKFTATGAGTGTVSCRVRTANGPGLFDFGRKSNANVELFLDGVSLATLSNSGTWRLLSDDGMAVNLPDGEHEIKIVFTFTAAGVARVDDWNVTSSAFIVPPPPIRGAWLLQDGVRRRWVDAGLDDIFRDAWPDKTRKDINPYNIDEARAAEPHPRPYCVVEFSDPIPKGNSGGRDASTEITYQDHPVKFNIFGTTRQQAKDFAILVAGAYVKKNLTLQQDRHIETLVDPDFCVRDADRTWHWVLQYRVRLEGDYPLDYT